MQNFSSAKIIFMGNQIKSLIGYALSHFEIVFKNIIDKKECHTQQVDQY